jgi:malonate-semialdehyde dehydrogenase (acetylating)/methylmalonate-semialdehyde dehydrogenase
MATAEAGMCGVNVGVPVRASRSASAAGTTLLRATQHHRLGRYWFWTRQRKITTKWALQHDANWMS